MNYSNLSINYPKESNFKSPKYKAFNNSNKHSASSSFITGIKSPSYKFNSNSFKSPNVKLKKLPLGK